MQLKKREIDKIFNKLKMEKKFGKVFGLILVGVVFLLATGCGKSDFEKLQAATEGKYFDSKETDGKILFVPLRTNAKVIKETVNDPKMTFLSFVGSVSLNLGPVSVTIDADKMAEGLPGYCIGSFEQRTKEEKNICSQLFALALKTEGTKDGKSVDFVDYFPSKHDAEIIALSDRIDKLINADKFDEAEKEIKKLATNFRGTDRARIAELGSNEYRNFIKISQGNGNTKYMEKIAAKIGKQFSEMSTPQKRLFVAIMK